MKGPTELNRIYSPSNWSYVIDRAEGAYTADCPTIHEVYDNLGRVAAEDWIRIQITALFGASSSKDIGVADGIKLFASCFAAEVKRFKITELMLFFSRYKAGRYDNSYSSFDSKRIGNAFFKEFIPDRNNELDRIEREKRKEERRRAQVVVPEGYTSYTWYLELKKRAADGDEEAMMLLQKPGQ